MVSDSAKRFIPDRLTGYSQSEIIAEIRRVVLEEFGGIVPSRDHFEKLARVSRVTIAKRFGTYREGLRQAGFTAHKPNPRPIFTAEQVKTNLLEVLNRAKGYYFTQDYYRKNGGAYCEEVVKRRLGVRTWQSALEVIGAKKRPRIVHVVVSAQAQRRNVLANVTETDLFKEIDRIWRARGRRPTYPEFNQASQLGIRVYVTRYGSWTKAIQAFCKANQIPVQGLGMARARPTRDILLNELRSVQLKHPGAILTYDSYKSNGGTYGIGVFMRQFGSWTAAVNSAGSVSGKRARYSKDDLFDEIQRLWEQCGRQPTQKEMQKQGNISPKCYAKMYGSWTKAIHAFCEDRNDDPAPIVIPGLQNGDKRTPTPFVNTASSNAATALTANNTSTPHAGAIEPSPELIATNRSTTHAAADGFMALMGAHQEVAPEAPINIPSRTGPPRVIEHKTGRTVSPKLRFKVFKRDNFTCKACGRSRANHPGLELEADHVVAYSPSNETVPCGETILDNLQTLCRECNVGNSNL
ncbi:MAG: HNH endonuclease [Phycisphaerales bacterium]|nr:HNH endonuclease [Phycisphaerales bacterium]